MSTLEQVRQLKVAGASSVRRGTSETEQPSALSDCRDKSVAACVSCWTTASTFVVKGLNSLYDVLALLISLADVATDVWVLYSFYVNGHDTFFTISLVILILAQLAYSFAFVLVFSKASTFCDDCAIFLSVMPFSPIISFVFFITSFEDNFVSKLFVRIGLDDGKPEIDLNGASILVWIDKKMRKHAGFILEAVLEALPQSIIQLIAMMYFQETNVLNVISIIISLTSVATKSMVFSFAIDFKVFIFNWLSLVTDIFSVFAIIGWVFYFPQNGSDLTLLGQIWIYKASISWATICILCSLPIAMIPFMEEYVAKDKSSWSRKAKITKCLVWFMASLIGWIVLSLMALLACETILFTPISLILWLAAHEHFTDAPTDVLAKPLFEFVFDNKPLNSNLAKLQKVDKNAHLWDPWDPWDREKEQGTDSEEARENAESLLRHKAIMSEIEYSDLFSNYKEEQIFRLCFINYFGIKHLKYNADPKLISFLDSRISSGWRDITLKELRDNCKNPAKARFWSTIYESWVESIETFDISDIWQDDCWDTTKEVLATIYWFSMLYVWVPLFCLSRLFSMMLPVISMALYGYGTQSVQLLQLILTIMYGVLIVSWIVAAIVCFKFYYRTSHMFPTFKAGKLKTELVRDRQIKQFITMQEWYNQRCM